MRSLQLLAISLAVGLVIAVLGVIGIVRDIHGPFALLFGIMAILSMVGLCLSALITMNAHNISLTLASVLNCVIYTLGVYFLLKRVGRERGPKS